MNITCESGFLYAPVHPGFLEGFEGRSLRVGEAGFGASLGKRPAAGASLDQQEFDLIVADAITNRCNLLTLLEAAQVRQTEKLDGRPRSQGAGIQNLNVAEVVESATHACRVHDRSRFC